MSVVTDSLGLVGTSITSVTVDNRPPYADVTTPTKITAANGGDVFTVDADAHLYFPPHAFPEDVIVTVSALADSTVPASLPNGAIRLWPGYRIDWGASSLRKSFRLGLSYEHAIGAAGLDRRDTGSGANSIEDLAVYRNGDGAGWERVGGTVDPTAGRIELILARSGRYALFRDSSPALGAGTLAGLAFTPRVFSPTGAFADREVGISFTLGRPAPVTVRVYSRSGRLIREVAAGELMNAGANLVRWDGRDRNGGFAMDGIYLVTVEALGQTERRPLAIVK